MGIPIPGKDSLYIETGPCVSFTDNNMAAIDQTKGGAKASEAKLLTYHKVSNIRRTKYQNFNDSRLILQLSVPNPLKPSVKSIMKM